MPEKKSVNENKNSIIIMLVITVLLAAIVLLIYIPVEMGYSNLSCSELQNESILIINSANYCSVDSDCLIETEVIMGMCRCYEIINKDFDINLLREKNNEINGFYKEKGCPIATCAKCDIPKKDEIKCIGNKCTIILGKL